MAVKILGIKLEVDVSQSAKLSKVTDGYAASLSNVADKEQATAAIREAAYNKLKTTIGNANRFIESGINNQGLAWYNAQKALEKYSQVLNNTRNFSNLGNTTQTPKSTVAESRAAASIAADKLVQENYYKYLDDLEKNRLYKLRYSKQQEVEYTRGSVAEQQALYDKLFKSYNSILTQGMSRGAKFDSSSLVAGLSSAGKAAQANTAILQTNVHAVAEVAREHTNLFVRVGEAIGAYRVWNTAINLVTTSLRAVPKIGIELDSTRASLEATVGAGAKAGSAIAALDKEAKRTGIAIGTLRESFRGFQASTSLAGESLSSTWTMFTNLNTVITGLHLSTDKANGIFLAMAQIFNKGKVQSEELVKQLGNLLPGAFASFAAATGRMPQQLSADMKKGFVFAHREVEAFTNYLVERFQVSFNLASQSLNANVGRMSTSFTHLGEAIYASTSGAMNTFVKRVTSLTDYLTEAVKGINAFGDVLNGVFNVTIGIATVSLVKFITQSQIVQRELLALAGGATIASRAVVGLNTAFAFISSPAAIVAGLVAIGLHFKDLRDSARDTKKSIEEAFAAKPKVELSKPEKLSFDIANDDAVKKASEDYERVTSAIAKIEGTHSNAKKALLQAELGTLTSLREQAAKAAINLEKATSNAMMGILAEEKTTDIASLAEKEKFHSDAIQAELNHSKKLSDVLTKAASDYNERVKSNRDYQQSLIVQGTDAPAGPYMPEHKATEAQKALKIQAEEDLARIDRGFKADQLFTTEQFNKSMEAEGKRSGKESLKDEKDALRDGKNILADRLDAVDSEAKAEKLLLEAKLVDINAAYTKLHQSDLERLNAENAAQSESYAKQAEFLNKKIALTKQAGSDVASKGSSLPSTEEAKQSLYLLNAYNDALANNSVITEGASVSFKAYNQGVAEYVTLEKSSIASLQAEKAAMESKASSLDRLTASDTRSLEINKQLRTLTEEKAALDIDNANRTKAFAAESDVLNTQNKLSLEAEKVKYFELTDQIEKAIEAKRQLATDQVDGSNVSTEVKSAQQTNIGIDTTNQLIDNNRKQRDSLLEISDAYKGISDSATTALSAQLGGIQPLLSALTEMVQGTKAVAKERQKIADKEEDIRRNIKDPIVREQKLHTEQLKTVALDKAELSQNLTNASQIAGAASKMFAEKSAAAKAFHAVEVTLSLASMAMKVQEIAMSLKATAIKLVEGAASMFAQSGWGGFAGVAAMLAVVAGLGYAASNNSGPSSAKPTYSPTTGTVLGDSSASSDSVNKTYELLKDIHASEYAELRGINAGVAELSGGITDVVTRLFQAGGLKDFATLTPAHSILPGGNKFGSPIHQAIVSFLFGGKQTQTVTGAGIETGATAIADIMAGKNLTAQQFATVETKTKGGLFSKDKYAYSTQYAELDSKTQKALNSVFKSMGDTMLGLADNLGSGLSTKVKDYIIPALTVDLKGLDGEAAAKKLNGVISTALDTMATSVFGNMIEQYQQLGEGMLETAVRVVSQMAVVKDALKASGLSMSGDALAISNTLALAAGGLKEFQSTFEAYYDNFYSDTEKQLRLQDKLGNQLSDVGLSLASTREGYRKQTEALDINTEAGQEQYSMLLKLSGAANDYYGLVQDNATAALDLLQQQRDLEIALMEASGNAIGALTERRKDELAALDESLRFTQKAVWVVAAAQTNVTNAISAVSKAISTLSALAGKLRSTLTSMAITIDEVQERIAAKTVLTDALAVSRAGGSIDNFPGMEKALATIAKPSEKLYSSFADYAYEQATTGNIIAELATSAELQVSTAQAQLDAINGTTNAVLTVKEALASLAEALGIKAATLAAIDNANTAVKKETEAKTAYDLAAANSAKATKAVEDALANANSASKSASDAQLSASTPIATAPTTYVNGQSNNPVWEAILTSFNAAHKAKYGKDLDRPWTADGDAQRQYQALVGLYNTNSLAAQASAQATAAGLLNVANAAYALIPGYEAEALAAKGSEATAAAAYSTAKAYADAAKAAVPNIEGFDSGGNHSGGWRVVGENGPELENTAPSRIYSNSQSKSLVDNSELVAELKELRKLVAEQQKTLNEIARNSKDTAVILDSNTAGGGPMMVQVVA